MRRIIDYILTWLLMLFTLPFGVAVTLFEAISCRRGVFSFKWNLFLKYLKNGDFFENYENC